MTPRHLATARKHEVPCAFCDASIEFRLTDRFLREHPADNEIELVCPSCDGRNVVPLDREREIALLYRQRRLRLILLALACLAVLVLAL